MTEKEKLLLEADEFIAHGEDMEKRRLLSNRLIELMDAGASDAEIRSNLDFLKKQLGFADGGEIHQGIGSLSEIARRMNEGGEIKKGIDFITYKLLHRGVEDGETLSDDNQKTYLRLKEKYGPLPIKRMNGGGEVFVPTEEDLDAMTERVKRLYGFDPVAKAIEEGVDPDLALRIMMRESSGDHSKGSKKGALGLMGLMPITAEDVGVDRTDPLENYVGGLRYLKKMQNRFGPVEGLAAYNAGPTAVEEYGGIPPFKETQDYVRAILTPHTGVDFEDQIQTDAETALMQMPVQAASDVLRPRARPAGLAPLFQNELEESPRPMARPKQEREVVEAVEAAVRPSLREKYSPEGIEQMLIGTTGESLLPRQFQQG
tara:strand:- start:941 stop:2059 length:1119 start_codon:yes stop_codon:yes gene_type:complete